MSEADIKSDSEYDHYSAYAEIFRLINESGGYVRPCDLSDIAVTYPVTHHMWDMSREIIPPDTYRSFRFDILMPYSRDSTAS